MPEEFREFSLILRDVSLGLPLREITIEQQLNIEDRGWTVLGQTAADILTGTERIANIRNSRRYFTLDPMARQAVRLWTDYTFGSGMTFQAENDKAQEVLTHFWDSPNNRSVLSASGQRTSSDKLHVDGEIFPVVFLGTNGEAIIRLVDPIEITEIITDPNDIEDVLYYKREWADRQGASHKTYYRSSTNASFTPKTTIDSMGGIVRATDDGIMFHLPTNTIGQRGNPLLLPAMDWLFQYRRFLAARVAIMLALTRFAWDMKIEGGQAAVDAQKAKLEVDDAPPAAGSTAATNKGVTLNPIRTDSGASNAYQDGRMLKLQVSAATGIPEQYFGDISIGNLATAKTVELPMMKMFTSMQKVWEDFYQEINELVLENAGVPPDKWYVDRNWPLIAPTDMEIAAAAIEKVVGVFPEFAHAPEVQQMALTTLGIDDVAEVLDNLPPEVGGNEEAALVRALRKYRASLESEKLE